VRQKWKGLLVAGVMVTGVLVTDRGQGGRFDQIGFVSENLTRTLPKVELEAKREVRKQAVHIIAATGLVRIDR
jgi:hypothetical protein